MTRAHQLRNALTWGERRRFSETVDWLDIQEQYAGRRPATVGVAPEMIALLTYTSGTTGRAKGAMEHPCRDAPQLTCIR